MGAALAAIFLPMAAFGLLALLSLRFGAETRPGFDEKPVLDDRPNWPAIARRPPIRADDAEPGGGEPAFAGRARPTRPRTAATAPRRPAASPRPGAGPAPAAPTAGA